LTLEEARDVQTLAAGRLVVSPASDPGIFTIQAQQYVGTLVTGGLELMVRPKVSVENLFLLLGVGLPRQAWARETFAYSTARYVLPAFAAFFARTLERTLAMGLLRSYDFRHERVPAIRGRLDFAELVKHPEFTSPIACRFDEFSADIDQNRLLKAATRTLLRLAAVRPDARRELIRQLARFEEVSDDAPDASVVERMTFSRLDAHYEPALRLAAIALRNTSLIDRPGGADASAFMVDMNDLFQRFITDRLTRKLRGVLTIEAEPHHWLGTSRLVQMRPDLVFRRGGKIVHVADIKYKLTTTGRAVTPDYYQLLAYTTALKLPEGLLIYCQTEGTAPETVVEVRHRSQRLYTMPLNMAGGIQDVENSISQLAAWIRRHAFAEVARVA
jgi:5-methylcytosine-specific restriction enzyme subunit McrC